ncbi:vid22p [Saccharomyces arboricola H-6]|uniref:Vid22p n=1 Tax=Saccharomyces arboricola (strain H-6 / AS 2.3317 / CBS 10644) TaxID=1160507 RepID=J8Q1T0_SACAR|nr:vid22p [Saccharomyces arboricola H-6]
MRTMDTQVQGTDRGLVLPPMNSTASTTTAATTTTNTDTDTDGDGEEESLMVDGHGEWVPTYMLTKDKSRYLSHFLGANKMLEAVKCKHCDIVIRQRTGSTGLAEASQAHLWSVHKIDPNANYYSGWAGPDAGAPFMARPPLKNHQSGGNNNAATSSIANLLEIDEDLLKRTREREMALPLVQSLAIIIASENLPLSFVDNTAVRLLINQNANSLSFIDHDLIVNTIRTIAYNLDQIIQRTALRNNSDLSLIINKNYLLLDPTDRSNQLANRLKNQLFEMQKINFFSLNHSVWNNTISILSIQYYDDFHSQVKILPLIIQNLREFSNDPQLSIPAQLFKISQELPGLQNTVISMTLPRPQLIDLLNVMDRQPFFSNSHTNAKNYYHHCIISVINSAILPLFGAPKSTDTTHPTQSPSAKEPLTLLDSLIDLSTIDISNSIFSRINSFLDDLKSNSWQLDKFRSLCGKYGFQFKCSKFDLFRYSTATTSLQTFLNLRPIIEEYQSTIQIEKFNEIDFQIIDYLLTTLNSINRILKFFTSSKNSNFTYVLFSIMSIEKHLLSTLSTLQFQRLIAPFEAFLSRIQEFKTILFSDDMNLLAMFLCPAILFEREVLEYSFHTISLSEIVDKLSTLIFGLLKRFLNLHTIGNVKNDNNTPNDNNINTNNDNQSNSNNNTNSNDNDSGNNSNRSGNGNSDNNDHFSNSNTPAPRMNIHSISGQGSVSPTEQPHDNSNNLSFGSLNDSNQLSFSTISNEIDAIFLQTIQEDLYEYLSTVNSIVPISYRSYCEQSNFVRDSGRFKKRIITEDSIIGELEQPMNFIEELLDIHVPVCNAFWTQYLDNDAGSIIRILFKIMQCQSSSSIREEYSFLNDFVPRVHPNLTQEIIKIKLFNDQFVASKVDYDLDTLQTASQYLP